MSKYSQNSFGLHLKERQELKKAAPTSLRNTKEVQGARKVQVTDSNPHSKAANGAVKARKGKDLLQMLRKKKLWLKEVIPSCTTRSPKLSKLKKQACQDTFLASLEENIFYSLTQKEGRRFKRRRLASVIVGPTPPPQVYAKYPKRHLSINNAAKLIQFKENLQKRKQNEVNILTFPVHQSDGPHHQSLHTNGGEKE